ncbi:MAG: hypothetical protein HGA19_10820 [Oscillochloris sp.]|nr:hypothetical protein [Oscillochloris sp.]
MTPAFAQRLDVLHQAAITEAANTLTRHGFYRRDDGLWQGTLDLGSHGVIAAKVRLPASFPDALPDVYVDWAALGCRLPHVELSGRVCFAPTTGQFIDATRPRDLIDESLARARCTLSEGLSEGCLAEFGEELEAYWADPNAEQVWSICEQNSLARCIALFGLQRRGDRDVVHRLFADNAASARSWANRTGWQLGKPQAAFMLPLTTMFLLPRPGEPLLYSDVQSIVEQHGVAGAAESMQEWLRAVTLPVAILLTLPLHPPQGVAVVGVDLRPVMGQRARQAQRGFRAGHVPAAHALRFQSGEPVTRLLVERLDPAYILPRGGATTTLFERTVAVIGCGAVGSHIASHLAGLGVGRLRLIDPDHLAGGNIHRHVLGVTYLGFNKALGLTIELLRRYPHLMAEHFATDALTLLRQKPELLTDADLIVIAIGDPTIELRLNDLFGSNRPRLHAWVEPLGLGGHVLATGIANQPGCYRCLFKNDKVHGLVNKASFAAPGQAFQRTMGGCSGQFVPFAGLDADRIAGEAARLATQILQGVEQEHVLISIREDESMFQNAGFHLAPRARLLRPGERRRETRYTHQECPICGRWG